MSDTVFSADQQPAPPPQPASPQSRQFLVQFPTFAIFLVLCIVIAAVHFWQPSNPFNWALQAGLFLAGSILGHVVFLFEPYFGKVANAIGDSLANNRLTSELPATPTSTNSLTDTSPLKQSLILFLLPIVGILLLSSSRWAIGLGFLLGVSWVYFADMVAFLQNRSSEFPKEYFPPQQAQSHSVQTALVWYCLYMAILVIGLFVL